jgi:hypothetical protein
MVYIFYMSANSLRILPHSIESFGIQPDGKESYLVDHCPANTIMRDYTLSIGIQLIVDMSILILQISHDVFIYSVAWFSNGNSILRSNDENLHLT